MTDIAQYFHDVLGDVIYSYQQLIQYSEKSLDQQISLKRRKSGVKRKGKRKRNGKSGKINTWRATSKTIRPKRKLDVIIGEYESLNPESTEEFFTSAAGICRRFEEIVPSSEDIEKLVNRAIKDFDNEPVMEAQKKSRFWLRPMAVLGGTMGAGAITLGIMATDGEWAAYTAAALYSVSAATAMLTRKKDRESTRWLTYTTLLVGSGMLRYLESPDDFKPMQGLLMILQNFAMPGIYRSIYLSYKKIQLKDKIATVRKVSKFINDDSLRLGVALSEAHRGLRYINAVCQNEDRSSQDFQPQLDQLSTTLLDYFRGKATHEEITEARIQYVPPGKTSQKIRRVQSQVLEPVVKKIGYTTEEHAQLRSQRKAEAQECIKLVQEEETGTHTSSKEEEMLDVIYSSGLASADRIAGFEGSNLRDLIETKFNDGYKGKLIRNKNRGQYLLRRVWNKHGLENGTKVFKLQPRGSLRALYIEENGSVRILEVLTHPEYDALHKKS